MQPHKIAHTVFEIRQINHLWIEEHEGHFALFTKSDMTGAELPQMVAVHKNLINAQANMNALLAYFAPNIIEGTVKDVSEFDRPREGQS